ncbi:MAG: tRNA (adenosine(37)-N6)-threonylcarbamoyltransferase complex dimerization subunit type 1 TsaB [Deltaproteobacteria bacterium]|nr:tRNA (adenosine(37)-N6)-threonylcarbamoyltransferase complex dimerization subunit type 1 TsaB [Deltaproteobacteria bacterium]
MKILVLDTSAEFGGAALMEEETLRAQCRIRVTGTHSTGLWSILMFLLSQAGWDLEAVEAWAVCRGPGSFTGVRIGLATVKALALVTRKPVVAVSALEALASAWIYSPYLVCPLIDARKQEVYSAGYRSDPEGRLSRVLEEAHERPLQLAARLKEPAILVGSGAWLYRSLLKERLGNEALIPPEPHHPVSLQLLGAIACGRLHRGLTDSPRDLRPLYLRSPDAELKRPPAGTGERLP